MNDESQIRFVEAHSERDGCNQCLDIIFQKQSLGPNSFASFQISMIGARDNSLLFQKRRNTPRILNRQRVDDSIALEPGQEVRQPRHSLRLIIELDVE